MTHRFVTLSLAALGVLFSASACSHPYDESDPFPIPDALLACVDDPATLSRAYDARSDIIQHLDGIAINLRGLNRVSARYMQALLISKLMAQTTDENLRTHFLLQFPATARPFSSAQPDGSYALPYGFTIRVFDPKTEQQIEHDVLSFDSYFEGAELQYAATEMVSDSSSEIAFSLRWDARGALADMIDPEQKLVSPIAFRTSLDALGDFAQIEGLEGFAAILDLEAEWSVDYDQHAFPPNVLTTGRIPVDVRYHVDGARLPVRARAGDPKEALPAFTVEMKREGVEASARAALRYASSSKWTGTLDASYAAKGLELRSHDEYPESRPTQEPDTDKMRYGCP